MSVIHVFSLVIYNLVSNWNNMLTYKEKSLDVPILLDVRMIWDPLRVISICWLVVQFLGAMSSKVLLLHSSWLQNLYHVMRYLVTGFDWGTLTLCCKTLKKFKDHISYIMTTNYIPTIIRYWSSQNTLTLSSQLTRKEYKVDKFS